jgi:hypothetical protein
MNRTGFPPSRMLGSPTGPAPLRRLAGWRVHEAALLSGCALFTPKIQLLYVTRNEGLPLEVCHKTSPWRSPAAAQVLALSDTITALSSTGRLSPCTGHMLIGYLSSLTPMPVDDGVRVTSVVVAGDDKLSDTITPRSLINDTCP